MLLIFLILILSSHLTVRMLLARWLLLCCCAGLALTDRVLINRRARQRLPDRETAHSQDRGEAA